jgi:hypothetical protein
LQAQVQTTVGNDLIPGKISRRWDIFALSPEDGKGPRK